MLLVQNVCTSSTSHTFGHSWSSIRPVQVHCYLLSVICISVIYSEPRYAILVAYTPSYVFLLACLNIEHPVIFMHKPNSNVHTCFCTCHKWSLCLWLEVWGSEGERDYAYLSLSLHPCLPPSLSTPLFFSQTCTSIIHIHPSTHTYHPQTHTHKIHITTHSQTQANTATHKLKHTYVRYYQ